MIIPLKNIAHKMGAIHRKYVILQVKPSVTRNVAPKLHLDVRLQNMNISKGTYNVIRSIIVTLLVSVVSIVALAYVLLLLPSVPLSWVVPSSVMVPLFSPEYSVVSVALSS